MVCPAVLYFSYLLKSTFVRNKSISPETCLRIISTNLSETVLISRRIQQDIAAEEVVSSCKVSDRSLHFYKICIFLDFDKNFQNKTSEKSVYLEQTRFVRDVTSSSLMF